MLVTKRQKKIATAFKAIAAEDGVRLIEDLGHRMRRKGIDNQALRMLDRDVAIAGSVLDTLEEALADLQAAKGPVKALLVRAGNLGVTQVEIAKRINVSAVSLSRWASGKNQPTAENLEALEAVIEEIEKGDQPVSA